MAREDFRQAYKDYAVLLNSDLIVNDEFLAHFEKDSILSPGMLEDIEGESKPRQRRQFMATIRKRGKRGFERFVWALVQTGQTELAEALDPGLVQSWEEGGDTVDATGQPCGVCLGKPRTIEDKGQPFLDDYEIIDVDKAAAQSMVQSKECYPFVSKMRGRAVIFNNLDCDSPLCEAIGAFDGVNMCTLFERLGFKTDMHYQMTAQALIDEAKKERNNKIHEKADAFVFILFSDGEGGRVFGSDGKPVEFETLFEIFDGKNFPCMVGKPKIFIIQSFLGLHAVAGSEDEKKDKEKPMETNTCASHDTRGAAVHHDGDGVHEKADLICAKCVVPRDKCYSKENEGTRFIRALIFTFMERCHCEHLAEMFTEVNRKCAAHGSPVEQSGSSTKKVYFLPGYHEQPAETGQN